MIIQVRGTSGSGKSTLVKTVMGLYGTQAAVQLKGRKQPLCYIFKDGPFPPLFVPGHYEGPCGGCDSLKNVRYLYEEVLANALRDNSDRINILYEGLLASEDQKWALAFHQDVRPIDLVINLTTPIEECLAAVAERRRARYEAKDQVAPPLNPANTAGRVKAIDSACRKLAAAGVPVDRLNRAEALAKVKEVLSHG